MIPQSRTRTPPMIVPKACRLGDRGDGVRDLQVFLRDLGYPITAIDGVYENYTRTAVAMFQEANGLVGHGHWDEATESATGVLLAQGAVVASPT